MSFSRDPACQAAAEAVRMALDASNVGSSDPAQPRVVQPTRRPERVAPSSGWLPGDNAATPDAMPADAGVGNGSGRPRYWRRSDPRSRRPYYVNAASNISTWVLPADAVLIPTATVAARQPALADYFADAVAPPLGTPPAPAVVNVRRGAPAGGGSTLRGAATGEYSRDGGLTTMKRSKQWERKWEQEVSLHIGP